MTVTTRAAVLRAADQPYSIEDIILGDLKPSEVLVEVVGAGMCHTDQAGRARPDGLLPIILGHEGAGVITAVGSGVTRVAVGEHVVMSFASCGRCRSCLQGHPAYCDQFAALNLTGRYPTGDSSATDGDGNPVANRFFGQSSFAGHVITDERYVVVVDADLPLDLLGPLGCGIQTGAGCVLNEMKLQPGQSIAVFGAGAVGLAAVMAARLAGASEIVAVDLHESRLELAREFGATRTVNGATADVAAEVRGSSAGLDYSFETTGVPAVLRAAIASLGTGGLAVMVAGAVPMEDVSPIMLVGRRLTFSFEGDVVPQVFIPQLIRYWQEGRFPFDKLVRTYKLDDIDAAEADSIAGTTIKPVLLP